MLLVFSLAACDGIQQPAATQTAEPSQAAASGGSGTLQPSSTPRPSGYVTRTPAPRPPEASPTAVETLDVQPEELAGQTVTFWHPWQGQAGERLQEIVNEYNRSNPWGVTVEVSAFDGFDSLEAAFVTALVVEDPPSLMVAYDDRAQHWDLSGQSLVDLQPYISDPNWGMTAEEQADFYPSFWQQGSADAQQSGQVVTRQLGVPLHRSAVALFYNTSWAAELGYSRAPRTPFELRSQVCEAARARQSAAPDGLGGLMLAGLPATTSGREIILQPEQLLGWIGAFGGQVRQAAGAGYQFNTPEASRALQFLKDLQQDGCVYLDDSSTPSEDFAARQGLLYVASSAELPAIQAAFQAAGSQDAWTIIPFPTANGDSGVVAYGPSLVMPHTNHRQQAAAWTLLEWLVKPSNQARWVEAIGAYPTRRSTLGWLEQAAAAQPAWAGGLGLLEHAQAEPALPSWGVVRWMMSDALAELFSADFTAEQIPALLESLDQLAAEIHTQVR